MPLPSVVVTSPAALAAASAVPAASPALTVGDCDLCEKDQLLLRSLLRVLDGADGLHVAHGDRADDCDVVFMPARQPRPVPAGCIVVRVVDPGDPPDTGGSGLHVTLPLRCSNVGAVLREAADMAGPRAPREVPDGHGVVDLFLLLAEALAMRERRCTSMVLGERGLLVLDFEARVARSALPLPALLAGAYVLGPPSRTTPAERDVAASLTTLPMPALFWRLAQHLGDARHAAPPLPGRWRLSRWPDAVALSRPGMPRLAALLTSRPMDAVEAAAVSGLRESAVRWFLHASVALGLARPSTSEPRPAPERTTEPAATPSVFGRLRQHLKLW